MVHGQPVERVPGHLLGDDVAVDRVVDGEVRHVRQVRELSPDIGWAERKTVLQRGRQVGPDHEDQPGEPKGVSASVCRQFASCLAALLSTRAERLLAERAHHQ